MAMGLLIAASVFFLAPIHLNKIVQSAPPVTAGPVSGRLFKISHPSVYSFLGSVSESFVNP